MKHPTTIKRELKRLRGMRSRKGLEEETAKRLLRDIIALEWVLATERWYTRPSQRYGIGCRKGES